MKDTGGTFWVCIWLFGVLWALLVILCVLTEIAEKMP